MKSYTLQELSVIMQDKHYVTKERFINYFKAIHRVDDSEASRLYYFYDNLPLHIYNVIDDRIFIDLRNKPKPTEEELDDLLEKVKPLIELSKGNNLDYEVIKNSKEIKKKVYFENTEGKIVECVFNLNNKIDIISFAELLKKQNAIKIIDFFEQISNSKNSSKRDYIDIYDGDVFSTNDDWHCYEDGDIYLCTDGYYVKLLYTFGVGYILNGKPNFDKNLSKKNSYVLTLKKGFKKLGNIYVDCSFLIDKK